MRLLVIRGGAIGDFILTLPALAALRHRFPQCRIDVLGYPKIASLAVMGGLAEAVFPIEAPSLAGFFTRDAILATEAVAFFGRFHLIYSCVFDPGGIFQQNVRRCSSAQFIVGPYRPDENESLHATAAYLRPLEAIGIVASDPQPRLLQSAKNARHEPTLLALHPGSGSDRKNWPETHWVELLTLLNERGQGRGPEVPLRFLLIGGEAEGDRLSRLARFIPPKRLQLAQNLPLPELAQHLASCSAFVGHDSGISHLAAAVGVPSLILWGETNPQIWRPLGPNVEIFRPEVGLGNLPASVVRDRLFQGSFPLAKTILRNLG